MKEKHKLPGPLSEPEAGAHGSIINLNTRYKHKLAVFATTRRHETNVSFKGQLYTLLQQNSNESQVNKFKQTLKTLLFNIFFYNMSDLS